MKEQSSEEVERIKKCPLWAKFDMMMKVVFEVKFSNRAFFSPLPESKNNNFKPVLVYFEGVGFETLAETVYINKQDSKFTKSVVEVHRVKITGKMKAAMPSLFYLDYLTLNYLTLNCDWRHVFNLELENKKLEIENTPSV